MTLHDQLADLVEKAENWKPPTLKCTACGADYVQPLIAAVNIGSKAFSSACKCGSSSFSGSLLFGPTPRQQLESFLVNNAKAIQEALRDAERLKSIKEQEHCAWLVIRPREGRPSTIHICDSDTPGAFKVFRAALDATGDVK